MPALFVSHASGDDALVGGLERWLRGGGFDDLFVDHSSIGGGEKWREVLRASAGACRVVLCLVSRNWLASEECFSEFRAAWYMGKRIIPLLLVGDADGKAGERLSEIKAEDQGLDLSGCVSADGRLVLDDHPEVAERLRRGLRAAGALARIGLDPEAFAIDQALRPDPFPGLASFGDEDADAALFYGRSREIAETLEELRKMRAEPDRRPLVILGASGAGKSSLLRAGIIPRLRREAPAWLPLRAFRPGADPLLNFAQALARTLRDYGINAAPGAVRDRLRAAWTAAERDGAGKLTAAGQEALIAALEVEGGALRKAAGRLGASLLIGVDQAEEIARSDSDSGEALIDYLRAALSARSSWPLVFTIRTDSFPELQSHRRFQDLTVRGYDLRALPVFRFDTVVEQPAQRYGVEVETALVDELMEDAPKEDALPLLAFALQRLWRQYAASGRLARDNYVNVGRLTGLIEDAAERALRGIEPEQDVALPAGEPTRHVVQLGAATFVPALAQINDRGATIRRVAQWASLGEESRELLERFDRWRLVVRRGREEGGGTVEVAHEALFREWGRLGSWLEPEKESLETLRSIENAAVVWDRHARKRAWLDHKGSRLAQARRMLEKPSYRSRLDATAQRYLRACFAAAIQRRAIIGLWGVIAALVVIGGIGYFEHTLAVDNFARIADLLNQRTEADVAAAARYGLASLPTNAVAERLAASPRTDCFDKTDVLPGECELRRTGLVEPDVSAELSDQPSRSGVTTYASQTGICDTDDNGRHISMGIKSFLYQLGDQGISKTEEGTIGVWRGSSRRTVQIAASDFGDASYFFFSDDLRLMLVTYTSRQPLLINLDDGRVIATLPGHKVKQTRTIETPGKLAAAFSSKGDRVVTYERGGDGSGKDEAADGLLRVWTTETGELIGTVNYEGQGLSQVLFAVNDRYLILVREKHKAAVFDTISGRMIRELGSFDTSTLVRIFPAERSKALLVSKAEGAVEIWDIESGEVEKSTKIAGSTIESSYPSPDANIVILGVEPRGGLSDQKPPGESESVAKQLFAWEPGHDRLSPIDDGRYKRSLKVYFETTGPHVAFIYDNDIRDIRRMDDLAGSRARIVMSRIGLGDHSRGWDILRQAFTGVVFDDPEPRVGLGWNSFVVVADRSNGRILSVVRVRSLEPTECVQLREPARLRIWRIDTGTTAAEWQLTELGRQSGAGLRDWMCSPERRRHSPSLYAFEREEREANSYLKGLPPDVCEWQGLGTGEGWRQLLNRWRYILTEYDAYGADEPQ
jgi:TIR domain